MAKIYARKIREGKLTIEQVTERWRAQVEIILAESEVS